MTAVVRGSMGAVAQRIGGYEILQHLASGGMGRVYLARTTGPGGFERHVVLKILDLHLPENDPRVSMFLDEARVIGTMYHQHIAPAFGLERGDDGRYFLVMDYIHGKNAALVWDRTLDLDAALPLDFVVTVCAAAASALHYAHTRRGRDGRPLGVVHRDVSLSNLMIGFDGAIKLIDFGIVKAVDRSTITQVGFVKGKVGYMAPEQIDGAALDQRTDVFALGVVLYELATMTRAFRDETDVSTIERIKKVEYVPPSRVVPSFPAELEKIIGKALRREPADRYPDADVLARELSAFAHGNRYVMGDAAITEVMTQLFEDRLEPWLLEDGTPKHLEDSKTVPVDTTIDRVPPRRDTPRPVGRHLRTASEVIELTIPKDRHDQTPTTVRQSQVVQVPKAPPPLPLPARPSVEVPLAALSIPAEPVAARSVPVAPVAAKRPRRRSPVIWVLPLSILLLSGAAAWAIHEGYLGLAPDAHRDAAAPEPALTDAAAASAIDASVDAAEPDAATSRVKLHIVTSPSDATVLLDGNKLGHTPLDIELPTDADTHTLKVRRRGYESRMFEILLNGDISQDLTLQPAN